MHWDVRHQRACGFTLQVLHYGSAYKAMAYLADRPGAHPVEVARTLSPTEPDPTAVSHCLSVLRRTSLVKRGGTLSQPGIHAGYTLTEFGYGMMNALGPLADWAAGRYGLTDRDEAIQAAAFLFNRRWSFALMAAVVNTGTMGIEPGRAEAAVNGMMAAMPEGVARRMHPQPRYAALHELRDNGLISSRRAPTPRSPARVLYTATAAGESLMGALWPVAKWGLPWDAELSRFMGEATTWWEGSESQERENTAPPAEAGGAVS